MILNKPQFLVLCVTRFLLYPKKGTRFIYWQVDDCAFRSSQEMSVLNSTIQQRSPTRVNNTNICSAEQTDLDPKWSNEHTPTCFWDVCSLDCLSVAAKAAYRGYLKRHVFCKLPPCLSVVPQKKETDLTSVLSNQHCFKGRHYRNHLSKPSC